MKTRVLSLWGILMMFALFAQAQVTTSSVSGRIKDAKGIGIPGASVLLVHQPTGTKYGVITDAEGGFRLNNLNPGGPYKATISYIGYAKQEKEGISLSLGADQRLDVVLLEEGKTLNEVKISGTRGGLKTGTGTRIGEEQLKTLPTSNRSLQDVTRLTPQGSKDNSFVGTNFRYNNVTIDGAINNDAIGFSPSLGGQSGSSGMPGSSTRTNPVSLDAIQDVQVLLAPYDVKIGNFTGGSVNAVTRSGTNELKGSVYGFGRNAALVGRNRTGDNAKMPSAFHDYQTGFRLGFPIIKDKLFFFTNEEITRRQDPVILAAGSADMPIISQSQAQQITDRMKNAYGIDAGSFDNYNIYSRSNKFFNRLDWNINDKNQLTIRNNTIRSTATNLERDQLNFRFGSIDYKQTNNQSSTVAELKSRISNASSNSLVVGYSSIHDFRDPLSASSVPQIEISSNGGTIFLGTDREASIFNMKQKTFEFTDNFTYTKGKHTFTFGTHNELYNITYGFVNSWNGRVAYGSVNDFLNNLPSRVRTNFNYADNTRDNIMANPPATFKLNMYSVYAEDQFQVNDRLKITGGLRLDLADLPNMQPLSDKTTNAPVDVNYGTTYNYTLPKNIKNDYLGQLQLSPRLGFNFDVLGNQSLILRGGSGLFTGRVPFAWLGYAYYNNGVTYGAYDKKYNYNPANGAIVTQVPGTDPIKDAQNGNGEAGYAQKQGINVNDASGATQVDLIDNNFKMPKTWRSSLALDYKTDDQWKFTLEGIYTKVINDLKFQQINYVDNPTYMIYDTQHQQPIYSGTKINSKYTNAYLLSNTSQGYRYSITGQVSKAFPFGLDVMAAYTYGQSKDITNGIRNSMESNWQLNQALSPNNPGLAYSNFDIRNRIVSTLNYKHSWDKGNKYVANFSLFFSAQSGSPYSYGFVNATINGTGQTVSLVYIPQTGETSKFFAATPTGVAQAAAFDAFIDGNKYLSTRRGNFTERNGARTPWNVQSDFRFSQDILLAGKGAQKHTLTFTYDIINLTNLLNKDWGVQYFSPNTFNSMASVGLKVEKAGTPTAYPTYSFDQKNVTSYAKDFFASRYQMQLGLRYSF
ncbi:carboxypeptidase regulatory-like domain-containing protein [Pedobacter sp. KR3-3]|uniref:Carboxypeptidase regulatory-like domain-containing protein n=1 Tax=Pedobacter albus TaxID=3113905 RepID=A0ABU7I7E1_9SPHI|nr:carboxypeptidase regulatory-like domain-containing protein [Pedobacter sp. KR3-3]MEE1945380.1 carboxypeptidase regulatory-like domain-containing protein [Pedobacter sp. KR3-3]